MLIELTEQQFKLIRNALQAANAREHEIAIDTGTQPYLGYDELVHRLDRQKEREDL